MAYRADGLAMLLSSDWFVPVWHVCGLATALPERNRIKGGCRDIVSTLLGSIDTYWDVEFTESRGHRTEEELFACLKNFSAALADIERIRRTIEADSIAEDSSDSILIESLLGVIVSDYRQSGEVREGLSEHIYITVERALRKPPGFDQVKLAAKNATSQWDLGLNRVTSDVPRYLINAAQDLYDSSDYFSRSWALIANDLEFEETRSLTEWLNKWGLLLASKAPLPKL